MTNVKTSQSRCSAGVARADITPPVGIYHRMWGAATHERSTGVHRPLTATVLLLRSVQNDEASQRVIVAVDHCLLWTVEMNRLLDVVSSSTGIERAALTADHYDFDSLRVGIQPFISDFRGFVFQDVPFGVRLFGNRDNNFWQYNIGYFRRMEKDTNSGLNDLSQKMRRDHLFVANAYRQDFPFIGHTTQATIIHNVNRESAPDYFDRNGFLIRPAVIGDARPRNYNVTYVGLSGDGHIDRWNLTTSLYGVFGTDQRHPLAQKKQTIRAGFAAAELSRDFSWLRVRGNALIASGDKNPFDGTATGFDAIFENPQFAGADTSFFIRQAIPLLGGGGVALSQRNGVLPSLRSSKDQGQSNFVNPGLTLIGVGADADLTPRIRLIANISKLNFINTSSLSVLRNQNITSKNLGVDVSAGVQIRPVMSQNIVLNISGSALLPGEGLKQLYDEGKRGPQYSVLFNLILTY